MVYKGELSLQFNLILYHNDIHHNFSKAQKAWI